MSLIRFFSRSEFDHIIIKASVNGKEISREKVVKEKKRNQEEVSESQKKMGCCFVRPGGNPIKEF